MSNAARRVPKYIEKAILRLSEDHDLARRVHSLMPFSANDEQRKADWSGGDDERGVGRAV